MAVGDVNLAWHVGDRIAAEGPDFVFRDVAGLLSVADVAIANLECSLSDRGEPWPGKEEHFAAPAAAADALLGAGIDVVSMANNHVLDFGPEGLSDSLALLDERGIAHIGAGEDAAAARRPLVVEINGLKIALLAYVLPFSSKAGFNTRTWAARADMAGVSIGRPQTVRDDVAAARQLADVVVVIIHSGGEFRRVPKHNQVAIASAAVEAGASLVIGHGPHNLQGFSRDPVAGTLIAYSIGNFVFDEYVGRQNMTAVLNVLLTADGVQSVDWMPIQIEGGLPRPAVGTEIDRIMEQIALPTGRAP